MLGFHTISAQPISALTPPSGGPAISADAGSYLATGSASTLKAGYRISIGAGSYSLTGNAVDLKRTYIFSVDSAAYALAGNSAGFVFRALRFSGIVTAKSTYIPGVKLPSGYVAGAKAYSNYVSGIAAGQST